MLDRKKGATAADHHLGITSNKRPFCYKFKGRNRWSAINPVGGGHGTSGIPATYVWGERIVA